MMAPDKDEIITALEFRIRELEAEIERLRAENAKLKELLKEEYDRGWDEGIDACTTANREC